MSHNDNNPARSAWHHRPAIWALIVALGLAALAALFFAPLGGSKESSTPELLAPATGGAATAPAGTAAPAGGTAPARN
ncbi:hypothetical protein [Paracoccus contaminans]|uniref:Uncharacterized protein n=1 Tax=Paracoccus contaminans TaxID=1945662 RepID=A0A1W6CU64_9RHOB|nr:hypothetical protein [Paracoccus contaminans]ARJ68394.1 hypothetical protein B0A89_00725 [Paracoccus contaminans]